LALIRTSRYIPRDSVMQIKTDIRRSPNFGSTQKETARARDLPVAMVHLRNG
jgi:hypothetical protein